MLFFWYLRLFLSVFYFLILWVLLFCLHMCLCPACMQWPSRPEEGVGSIKTEVTKGYDPLCGFKGANPGPLEQNPASWPLSRLSTPQVNFSISKVRRIFQKKNSIDKSWLFSSTGLYYLIAKTFLWNKNSNNF